MLKYDAPHRKSQRLTRGVFPTAPVKPFTECDVKLLDSTDLNMAALEGIMVVGEKIANENLTALAETPLCNLYTIRHSIDGRNGHGDLKKYRHDETVEVPGSARGMGMYVGMSVEGWNHIMQGHERAKISRRL